MDDLPIQIVDAENNPTGSAIKQEAWRNGLIHRISRISILNDNGQILVQKRSKSRDLYPGRWDNSVAGHVDTGETYLQAALRELSEELGINSLDLTVLGDYYAETTYDWRVMKKFTRAYKAVINNPIPTFSLSPDEVESVAWMDINTVKELVLNHPEQVTDGLEQVISRYF